jgi:hypothetical protein
VEAGRANGALRTRGRLADGAAGLAEEVTGLIVATVVVHLTLHMDAGHQRVALQAHRADAARRMELDAALRGPAAWRGRRSETGVDTVLLDAGLV